MSKPIEITQANYQSEVVDSDIPVVLDFWANWCGPCRSLAPVLDKVAQDYVGKVKVGKVNVDNENQLAQQFGVRGIPMVVGLYKGKVKESVTGFGGELPLRKLFDALV